MAPSRRRFAPKPAHAHRLPGAPRGDEAAEEEEAAAAPRAGDAWRAGELNLRRQVELKSFGTTLEITQDQNTGESGTALWEVAVIWSRLLDAGALPWSDLDLCRGRRVLELGAGTGVAGMGLALRGARVTFCDLPSVVPHLRANVERNAARVRGDPGLGCGDFAVVGHDWHEALPEELLGATFDLVLATDCVYHAHLVDPFLATVLRVTAPRGTHFVLCYERRDEAVLGDFEAKVKKHFKVKRLLSAAQLRRALSAGTDSILDRDRAGDADADWLTLLSCRRK